MKGLELACDIRPDVPTALVGDPSRLRQIVTNLIGNAIKFTEHGEVVLTVDAETQTDRDAMLRFSVSDTGIGVPQEQQEAIFKPFVRLTAQRRASMEAPAWVSRFQRPLSRCWADASGWKARPAGGARSISPSGSIFSRRPVTAAPMKPGRRR